MPAQVAAPGNTKEKMKKYLPYILLLLLVILDASGDALRVMGFSVWHHIAEVAVIVGFILLWARFPFKWTYPLIYVLMRVWAFNLTFNICIGLPAGYLGTSNLYDRGIAWFAGAVQQDPRHFVFILSFMALVATIGLIIKDFRNNQ